MSIHFPDISETAAGFTSPLSHPVSGLWEKGNSTTWNALSDEVDALAARLAGTGVRHGDVVAVQVSNRRLLVLLHLAVIRIGADIFPVHQSYGWAEVTALLRRGNAGVLIADEQYHGRSRHEVVTRILDECPGIGIALTVAPDDEVSALRTRSADHAGSVSQAQSPPHVLLASSGTTSTHPKICRHTHSGLLANARTVAEHCGHSASDVYLAAGPMSHAFGLSALHLAMSTGGSLALVESWEPRAFLDSVQACGATVLLLVPAQLRDLLTVLRESGEPAPSTVREIRTGGAAVPRSLVAAAASTLGAEILVQWGMTEVGVGCYTLDTAQSLTGSVGTPIPGARVRVRRTDGTSARPGEVGDLQINSPFTCAAYRPGPEQAPTVAFDDGWVTTGDLAALTPDGQVFLHGRRDERINRGGLKYDATEVEALLAELPALRQYAVVACPDQRLGQRAVLVVALQPGATLALDDVVTHLRARGIASYKFPESLLVLDSLPLTAVGKLARKRISDLAAELAAAPEGATGRHS